MMPVGEYRPEDEVVVVPDEQNEQVVPRHARGGPGSDVLAVDDPARDDAPEDEPIGDEQIGDEQIGDEQIADERAVAAGPAATAGSAEPVETAGPAGPVAPPAPGADDTWPAVQALFVDDPRRAVERAAELTSHALNELAVAARNHEQLLRAGWESGEADTEELRTALRGYRELAGRVTQLASQF